MILFSLMGKTIKKKIRFLKYFAFIAAFFQALTLIFIVILGIYIYNYQMTSSSISSFSLEINEYIRSQDRTIRSVARENEPKIKTQVKNNISKLGDYKKRVSGYIDDAKNEDDDDLIKITGYLEKIINKSIKLNVILQKHSNNIEKIKKDEFNKAEELLSKGVDDLNSRKLSKVRSNGENALTILKRIDENISGTERAIKESKRLLKYEIIIAESLISTSKSGYLNINKTNNYIDTIKIYREKTNKLSADYGLYLEDPFAYIRDDNIELINSIGYLQNKIEEIII